MHYWVGTSGYSYPAWKGGFYPEKTATGDMLSFYASQLPAVEINNTFYRLPKRVVLAAWKDQVPDSFRFVIKASRRITHMARLKEAQEPLGFLIKNVAELGGTLGAILFQTPPYLRKDKPRLELFLEDLPPDLPCAFDFHHDSWLDDEIRTLLEAKGHALCVVDKEGASPETFHREGTWGYLRLRGEAYTPAQLAAWQRWVSERPWSQAFIFFKHEEECAGPDLAKSFLSLLTR